MCKACKAGNYCPAGASAALPCAAGSYSPNTANAAARARGDDALVPLKGLAVGNPVRRPAT